MGKNSTKVLDSVDRELLYKLYTKLQECKSEIEYIIRGTSGWPAAKAYWYASLSLAINDEEYVNGGNPTMRSFLLDEGIIDKTDSFVEDEDDDEVEDEDEG